MEKLTFTEEFSFGQMTSNSSNGKTSASKVAGIGINAVGLIMLLYSTFFVRDIAVLNALLFSGAGMVTLGSGLLVGKIIKPTK